MSAEQASPRSLPRRIATAALRLALVSLCLLAGLLAALLLAVHLPPVQGAVRRTAEREAGRSLGARAAISSLRFSLLRGTVEATGLSVDGEKERAGTSIRAERLRARVSLPALLRGRLVVEEADLVGLSARLALAEDGRLLLPFAPSGDEEETPAARPDVVLRRVSVAGGPLELDDRGPARRRVVVEGLRLGGGLRLKDLQGEGSLAVGPVSVEGGGEPPLGGTTLALDWRLTGASGTLKGRLDAPEAGLSADLACDLTRLDAAPAFAATAAISGTLGPLAGRLLPDLGLAGTLAARASVEGTFEDAPAGSLSASVDGLRVSDRELDRLELTARLAADRTLSLTADATAALGRLHAETTGPIAALPGRLAWRARFESFPAERLLPARQKGPRLASDLSGTVEGRLETATLAGASASADLRLSPAPRARRGSLSPEATARLRLSDGVLHVEELRLRDGETRADLSGTWDAARGGFDASVDLDAREIAPYLALAGVVGRGTVAAKLAARGTPARPEVEGTLRGRALSFGGATVDRVDFRARLLGTRLSASEGSVAAHGSSASFDADLDLTAGGLRPSRLDLRLCGVSYAATALPDLHAEASLGPTVSARLTSADGSLDVAATLPPKGPSRVEARLERLDLSLLAPLLPFPVPGFGGELTASAAATFGTPAPPQADLSLAALSLTAGERKVVSSAARASLAGGRLTVEGLDLSGDDGSRLSLSGHAALDGSELDARVVALVPDLSAWKALLPEGASPSGSVSADLTIGGSLQRPRPVGSVAAASLAAFGLEAARVEAAVEAAGEDVAARVEVANLRYAGLELKEARLSATRRGDTVVASASTWEGRLRAEATANLVSPHPFEATFDLAKLDLRPVLHALGASRSVPGEATGRLRAKGELAEPSAIDAELELTSLSLGEGERQLAAARPIALSYRASRLEVRSLDLAGPGLTLSAAGSLPRRGRSSEKLSVRLRADLAALLPFVPQLDRAEGTLDGSLDVAGSAAEPGVTGRLTLADGLLDGPAFPFPLEGLAGAVALAPDAVTVESLTAKVGRGAVGVSGKATLDGVSPHRVEARLKARDVDFTLGNDLEVRGGADLEARGTWPAVALAGEVRVEDAVYTPTVELTALLPRLTDARRRRAEAHAAPGATAPRVSLDVALVAIDAIHVQGNVGEVDLGGSVRVGGTLDRPTVLGHVASSRGSVNLLGSRFDLTRARLDFQDPRAVDPDVDVVATTTKSDDEITARIMGKASKAQLLLSSSKGRSQADTMALLLGSSSGSSSTALADAAAKMAVRGAASPLLGAVGMQTDLQIVPLPTTPEGEEFLFSVGKELGGGLSATYFKGTGGTEPDAFELKWRITSRARGRVRQNQDGSLSGGFRIRREFN